MIYRELIKNGDKISQLGYGCMRFPTKNGRIDENRAISQMYLAYDNGVNYYDTAYPYHGGKSEVVLGKFIEKYNIRDKVYIADKLPAFLVNKPDKIEKFFNTQLKRLNTTYIDYYLMHMLDSLASWQKLKDFGIISFIEEEKKKGRIRYIGFSFHGKQEEFIKIIDDYEWDFCQIQYNYLDEYTQAGKIGLEYAYSKNIGCIIMEPLRGGNLANKAPDLVRKKFHDYDKTHSPAYFALRWLYNHKEVKVVLSGMNEEEHIKENILVAKITDALTVADSEIELINDIKKIYHSLMKVPCTGCGYCMPCPYGVDIPRTFNDYNSKYFFGGTMARFQYIGRSVGLLGMQKSGADLCKECGLCEKHCPQHIEIRKELKNAHKELDNKFISTILKIATFFMKKKKDK